ncbi:MAG: metal ABC transporter ATP-binding protein [Sporolactobacillus sp.]
MLQDLEVKHLHVSFNGEEVLQDLSFQVTPGEMFAVIGPNGAGKSTLLKVILGIIHPQKGECLAKSDGRTIIGYVPQSRPIDDETPIRVKDFISLGLSRGLLPWLSRQERHTMNTIMSFTHMTHLAGKSIGQLSGGERQRAFLAQALVRQPDLLLLDESTANLDPGAQEEMMQLVQQACRDWGVSVIFISHDLQQVTDYADEVLLMARGRYVKGSTSEIMDDDERLKSYYQAQLSTDGPVFHHSVHESSLNVSLK